MVSVDVKHHVYVSLPQSSLGHYHTKIAAGTIYLMVPNPSEVRVGFVLRPICGFYLFLFLCLFSFLDSLYSVRTVRARVVIFGFLVQR